MVGFSHLEDAPAFIFPFLLAAARGKGVPLFPLFLLSRERPPLKGHPSERISVLSGNLTGAVVIRFLPFFISSGERCVTIFSVWIKSTPAPPLPPHLRDAIRTSIGPNFSSFLAIRSQRRAQRFAQGASSFRMIPFFPPSPVPI